MPSSFVGAPLSAPTAAPRTRRDALEEAWAALSIRGDALREPRDALLKPRDALAVRGDVVRRREGDSRRITRSSRSPPDARWILEAAAGTRRAALATQGDASRAPRDAVDAIRDAQRGEDDALGEAWKPAPTSAESSPQPRRSVLVSRGKRRAPVWGWAERGILPGCLLGFATPSSNGGFPYAR
jgi:hypothetical protein